MERLRGYHRDSALFSLKMAQGNKQFESAVLATGGLQHPGSAQVQNLSLPSGMVEQYNRTLLDMLSTLPRTTHLIGKDQLVKVYMAYNTSIEHRGGSGKF